MKKGLLIIDRGSREKEAFEELEAISKKVKEKGNYDFVDFCFLEVIPPFIKEGINKCLKQNLDSLTIVPYFLYPGKKVKIAVAEAMKFQEKTRTKFIVTKPMIMHEILIDLVDNRICSSLEEKNIKIPRNKVDVLVIGHGSKDPNAQISLNYIVEGLKRKYRNVERCFLEIEYPDIPTGIKNCEKNNPENLVIVFYFLHEGIHVKSDINQELKPALKASSIKSVHITKHLGADEKMIDLILRRAKEVEDAD